MDTLDAGSTARPHTVLCVEMDDVGGVPEHRHVIAVEIAGANGVLVRWTAVQLIAAMRDGEVFVVGGRDREQAAVLEPMVCSRCPQVTVATDPPPALTSLPSCR